MARKIYKKVGGDRIGSGNKMNVEAHGYGFSTHDVGKVRRTSMSFGTIVPMGQWLMLTGSKMRMNLSALITSNALSYQLYGSAKFQLDVFKKRVAGYNAKMQTNLLDQGYEVSDVKFPLMELKTRGIMTSDSEGLHVQINKSALLAYLGVRYNGQDEIDRFEFVTRRHMAMFLMMYYETVKEYYCNKQEKVGMMIHNVEVPKQVQTVTMDWTTQGGGSMMPFDVNQEPPANYTMTEDSTIVIQVLGQRPDPDWYMLYSSFGFPKALKDIWKSFYVEATLIPNQWLLRGAEVIPSEVGKIFNYVAYNVAPLTQTPKLVEWDLKAVDRMTMRVLEAVGSDDALLIEQGNELPYGASFETSEGSLFSCETSQEALCIGTFQSDVFNNYLDNAMINNLANKNRVKVAEDGTWSINDLNITQKLYNYNQRIGVTDGSLEEWREMTYGELTKSKSLKPVYCGGLSKEVQFDMVVSTASTEEEPLGSIASRGQFGSKHKGGYVEIDTDEELLVQVLCKITPRLVYNQGNEWTTNLKSLDDLHKPELDKIGYQDLVTDTMFGAETIVKRDGTLQMFSAGKQPAWQWYRTNYDDALGNMADIENYKVFGREYDWTLQNGKIRIKDLTTYIDPQKFNDVFAIKSLDAMNFDVQVGMDVMMSMKMSEEVIPNL